MRAGNSGDRDGGVGALALRVHVEPQYDTGGRKEK